MSDNSYEASDVKGFVAVHIGAGYHSPANCELYENVCREACKQAIELLKQRKTALEAVTAAVVSLEDSQWTNAGLGSNLSLAGTVECDASIMDGKSLHFGAVGALSCIKNPILVAESLLRTQMAGAMSLGRVAPSTLVAHGAQRWAVRHKIPTCETEGLITEASKKAYIKNKRKLDMFEEGVSDNSGGSKVRRLEEEVQSERKWIIQWDGETKHQLRKTETDSEVDGRVRKLFLGDGVKAWVEESTEDNRVEESTEDNRVEGQDRKSKESESEIQRPHEDDEMESHPPLTNGCTPDVLQDTVGAICVDGSGAVASAVSSGGIILKQPGRLGQAALYGCGCWAENDLDGNVGVGVSTSGCGEQLSKTLLAKVCSDSLKNQENPTAALYNCFKSNFLESPYLRNEKQPLGGAVAVTVDSSNRQSHDVEVLWAHTTDSMCVAFMSSHDHDAKAFVSRLPPGVLAGKAVVIQSESLSIGAS